MSDVVDALTGGKLAQVRARPDHRGLSLTTDRTIVFSVDDAEGRCALRAEAADAPVDGDAVFDDGRGRKVVRVTRDDDRASFHLDEGTILHVLAVRNEDGCRIAMREEREHGRGVSSLLDRLLARVR